MKYTLESLQSSLTALHLSIPCSDDVRPLTRPVRIASRDLPNAMATHPMEGCDGLKDGSPGELTFRRYRRFAEGGAGLLWFEACAVREEGRSNPRQLMLTEANRDVFARLLEETHRAAKIAMGAAHRPFTVLQLTHSGRYSRPGDKPSPVIAFHDPILDADRGIPADYPAASDDYLKSLEEDYVKAAKLAFEAGFDAVDVKACHRYLMSELLAAHTRAGEYGGSYENRTRLLQNIIGSIQAARPRDGIVTTRLGIFDAHPYPYGWGVGAVNESVEPNLTEPKRLVSELAAMGVALINISMGNPYHNPHVNRPYEVPLRGKDRPSEDPLIGVARLLALTAEIARHEPRLAVIGSGVSWLRELWPHVAAGCVAEGWMRIVGLGRQAFAYPGFAKEIIETSKLDRKHTCLTCSRCTQIMRDGGQTGCAVLDKEIYGPIYRRETSPII